MCLSAVALHFFAIMLTDRLKLNVSLCNFLSYARFSFFQLLLPFYWIKKNSCIVASRKPTFSNCNRVNLRNVANSFSTLALRHEFQIDVSLTRLFYTAYGVLTAQMPLELALARSLGREMIHKRECTEMGANRDSIHRH